MKEQEIIEFLKSQEKELKANDLIKIYHRINVKNAPALTKFFLDHGIDPLKYVTMVPRGYADGLQTYYTKRIMLPDNIEGIDVFAFSHTNATELYIPPKVYFIRDNAFSSSKLEKIYIDGAPKIQAKAFSDCKSIQKIKIECTEEEWYKQNPAVSSGRFQFEDWPYVFRDAHSDAKLVFLK